MVGAAQDPQAGSALQALAAYVRQERERLGWSQAEAAGYAGLSKRTWQQIEAARSRPRRSTLARVAAALGTAPVRLWDLAEGEARPGDTRRRRLEESIRTVLPGLAVEDLELLDRLTHRLARPGSEQRRER